MKKMILSVLVLTLLGGCLVLFRYVAVITTIFNPLIMYVPPLTAGYALPGASPAHHYVMGPPGPSMELYGLDLEYAPQFGISNFGIPGGAKIGTYTIRDRMGVVQSQVDILPLTNNTAFVDLNQSTFHNSGFEPKITHSLTPAGNHRISVTIPTGGDGSTMVNARNFIDMGEITFNAGLLVNPATPGTYPGTATFTSVDPDSGSANDNAGTPPTVVTRTMQHTITSGATASISTDATHYGTGHTMKASLAIDNPGGNTSADVYIALLLPTGGLLFVHFDPFTGQPVFSVGDVANPATWVAAAPNLALAAGFNLASFTFLQFALSGLEPLGLYTWFIGLTTPGTFNFFLLNSSQFYVQ